MILITKSLFLTFIITNLFNFLIYSNTYGESNWPQFRGQNFNGVALSQSIPKDFSPENKLIWKISTPIGHSSPIIWDNKIFITGHDNKNFKSICLNREKSFFQRFGSTEIRIRSIYSSLIEWKSK